MVELEAIHSKGVHLPKSGITVAQHLDNWLEGYVKTQCSQRTYGGYESTVRQHIKPSLGRIELKKLTPQVIQAFYGKECSKVSERSVAAYHRLLKQALSYGVRQEILGRNVCDLVDPPRWRSRVMRTLTPDELATLLETAEGSQFYPVIYTAVSTGMRQAELLGLRWRDLDLDHLSISVSRTLYKRGGVCEFKEPKTSRSRRRIVMTSKLATFLTGYKQDRMWLGQPVGLDDLVFCHQDGKPLDPSVLSHEFARLAKTAGLGGLRFHDLRHTFASIMLMRGAKPKVISEALGHASVAFTMDIYSHILEGMHEDAMALLDEVMPSGVARKSGKEASAL
jgi:integrase